MLVAGILLASRFRFLFLEEASNFSLAQISKYESSRLVPKVRELLREWRKIDIEAADAGLSDKGELTRLIGHPEEVDQLYADWWAWIEEFEVSANKFVGSPGEDSQASFICVYKKVKSSTDRVNRRFIALCLEAYERRLRT